MNDSNSNTGRPYWSVTVRVIHWVVAIGVLVNFVNDTGFWHRIVGYTCVFFVLLRLIHGLWQSDVPGSGFFIPGLQDIRLHLHEIRTGKVTVHSGHNPLGQLAVYVMWGLILLLAVSGWLSRTDRFWGEDLPVDIHAMASLLLQGMVLLHLLAVLILSRLQQRNLIKAMLKG